ncbi:DUF2157 domain-containing protein [Litoribaculum gwangyangense]|uniref:DUF2157 domain-containing protein n=1 Tax=Litoribaculum gwangyangense TaxID=1130722 RepID=A0ABP9CPC7_9FLAO
MNSKIRNDIKELVLEQVISQETASKIETYYESKENDSPNKLFTVFAVLGSILVGLGIILILAHNWDHFSRSIKTFFAFLPLVIAQVVVGYSILKNKSATWKESSGVFLFFAVGSSMALVSQIYNIPGELSSYLLTWVLLCLPLVYLLKSNALAILHIAFSTYYACEYGYFYNSVMGTPWLFVLLIVSILPYYFTLLKIKASSNIVSIFNWLLPLCVIIVLGAFVDDNEFLGFLMYVVLFGVFYNLGMLPYFKNEKLRRNGYLVLGSLGTIFMLILTSFKWFWQDRFNDAVPFNSQEFYISAVLFLSALGILTYGYLKNQHKKVNLFQLVFIIFSILFFLNSIINAFPVIIINLLILVLGVVAIKIGASKLHFGVLNYGLLIISLLIVCRFFDTNMSFVVRGLLFVVVGVGFFFVNYLMLKKQKSIKSFK